MSDRILLPCPVEKFDTTINIMNDIVFTISNGAKPGLYKIIIQKNQHGRTLTDKELDSFINLVCEQIANQSMKMESDIKVSYNIALVQRFENEVMYHPVFTSESGLDSNFYWPYGKIKNDEGN